MAAWLAAWSNFLSKFAAGVFGADVFGLPVLGVEDVGVEKLPRSSRRICYTVLVRSSAFRLNCVEIRFPCCVSKRSTRSTPSKIARLPLFLVCSCMLSLSSAGAVLIRVGVIGDVIACVVVDGAAVVRFVDSTVVVAGAGTVVGELKVGSHISSIQSWGQVFNH